MEISEVQTRKVEMEERIHAFIANEVREFRFSTGICPSDIRVEMIEETTFGDRGTKFFVSQVIAKINL